MVALFVILTIVVFLLADFILLKVREYRGTHQTNLSDIFILVDGKPCMADGGERIKKVKRRKKLGG